MGKKTSPQKNETPEKFKLPANPTSNIGKKEAPTKTAAEKEVETKYITLKVVGRNNEIHFKVKMTTQMGKLKKSYSERVGAPITSLRFLFDGKRISDEETPKSMKMVGLDIIDVCMQQKGGGQLGCSQGWCLILSSPLLRP